MRLFYFLNGLAGQNDAADAVLRLFYVCAVPLLATILAALLFLPRAAESPFGVRELAPSRRRLALATILAGALCALAFHGITLFAQHFFGTDTLSPRPFVTHRVNALLIEPNDNSFPCPEVMLAAALAACIWAARPRGGWVAFFPALALAITHVICGSNYPLDVWAGLGFGATLGALALGLCRVPLRIQTRRALWLWRSRYQAACGAILAILVFVATLPQANSALYAAKSGALWGASAHAQSPLTQTASQTRAGHEGKEGEGAADTPTSDTPTMSALNEIPRPGVTELGGHLPIAERGLLAALGSEKLAHRLVSVDVAQIKTGNTFYRCAAVRFEVRARGASERRRVAATAAQIVRRAFRADSQLQNVDVTAVVLNVPQDDSIRTVSTNESATDAGATNENLTREPASDLVFARGVVPVFTASIARRNLIATGALAWTNLPAADAGSWLRARSRLYINPRVLPARDAPILAPTPTSKPTPTPSATPVPTPTLAPTATPTIAATATPTIAPKPTPTIALTATPQPVPTSKPAPAIAHPTPQPIPTRASPVMPIPTARPTMPKPAAPRVAPKPYVTPKFFTLKPNHRTWRAISRPRAIRRALRRPRRLRRVYRHYSRRYYRRSYRRTIRNY